TEGYEYGSFHFLEPSFLHNYTDSTLNDYISFILKQLYYTYNLQVLTINRLIDTFGSRNIIPTILINGVFTLANDIFELDVQIEMMNEEENSNQEVGYTGHSKNWLSFCVSC
ncbi:hypothetical protein, partial [Paenibacillus larvae]